MVILQQLPENNSIKRKHQDSDVDDADVMMMINKKKKIKLTHSDDNVEEDRLTKLPEPIILHILSLLNNSKQAVQTSALSKPWVSLWKWIPVLKLDAFYTKKLCDFDKFVTKVIDGHDVSVKLNKLTFIRHGSAKATLLEKVFDYALSNGVKQVKAWIEKSRNEAWPDCLHTICSDSLTRLKLKSDHYITCQFLAGQKSAGLFKNLTNLYLRKAIIRYADPFSSFPALEKLSLYDCHYEDPTLNIRASLLLALTIKCNRNNFDRCELSTPKLKIFKFLAGGCFPVFVRTSTQADDVVLDYHGPREWKQSLIGMFWTFHDAKSLTISRSVVELLSNFSKEFMTQSSPFRGLKFLKLDRGETIPSDVKDYLLRYSAHDAKISMIDIYKYFHHD